MDAAECIAAIINAPNETTRRASAPTGSNHETPEPFSALGLAGYRITRGLAGWAFPSPHIVDGSILMWLGKGIMRVNTWLRRFESVLI
jgi:hypothetical protein